MDKFSIYDLAYTFKKSKVWQLLREQQVFAVSLPDSQIGYCYIMGQNGEHMALSLHVGAEGFSSYRLLNALNQRPTTYEDMLQQDCIQCSIEKRDQFSLEELDELRAYCEDRGIPFRAPFPQFGRYKRYCVPWMITEEKDWEAISMALTIVAKIIETIGRKQFDSLMPHMIYAGPEGETYLDAAKGPVTIPLYSIEDGELKAEQIPLPPYTDERFASPTIFNEVALRKLMKMPRGGTLQCEIVRGPEPVDGEPPYLPAFLITIYQDGESFLTPVMSKGAAYDPNEMLDGLLNSLVNANLYPETILLRTEETAAILKPFCQKAKIRLMETDELKELDETVDMLMEHLYESDETGGGDAIEALQQMSIEQISELPDFLLEQLLQMEGLPKQIMDKIKAALK